MYIYIYISKTPTAMDRRTPTFEFTTILAALKHCGSFCGWGGTLFGLPFGLPFSAHFPRGPCHIYIYIYIYTYIHIYIYTYIYTYIYIYKRNSQNSGPLYMCLVEPHSLLAFQNVCLEDILECQCPSTLTIESRYRKDFSECVALGST